MEATRLISPYDFNTVYQAILAVLQVDLKAEKVTNTATGYTGETATSWLKNSWGEVLTASCEPSDGGVYVNFSSDFKKQGTISSKNKENISRFTAGLIARLPGTTEDDPAVARSQAESNLPLVEALSGGLQTALESNRMADEQVLISLQGMPGQAIVVTNRRVMVIKAGSASGSMLGQKAKSFDIPAISSVEFSCGFSQGRVQISASGTAEQTQRFGQGVFDSLVEASRAENVVQFPATRKHLFQAAANRIRQLAAEAKAPKAVSPPIHDVADQIRKLAELRTAGILTEDEFQAKKADLLARM